MFMKSFSEILLGNFDFLFLYFNSISAILNARTDQDDSFFGLGCEFK
jgi:hypothetical protein